MTDHFESQKNIRAGTYTGVVLGVLLLIFLFVSWTVPTVPLPPVEDGIEVNLGNTDNAFGDDQPESPGKPAPSHQPAYTPPKVQAVEENVKDVETDDDNKEDAPVVKKPDVVKPNATKIPEKEVVKTKPVKVMEPTPNPTPAPPKPKAVFKGVSGEGNGGNEADSYKKGSSQGVGTGKGDMGKPGGSPTSTNYEGNGGHGNSGISISRGLQGRRINRFPSFEDDFNENAKVAVDIKVDANGNVTDANYQPRGSTTSDGAMKAIALRKAREVKFNAGSDESVGTIIFNFKLKN